MFEHMVTVDLFKSVIGKRIGYFIEVMDHVGMMLRIDVQCDGIGFAFTRAAQHQFGFCIGFVHVGLFGIYVPFRTFLGDVFVVTDSFSCSDKDVDYFWDFHYT